jgi:hypothetical protein
MVSILPIKKTKHLCNSCRFIVIIFLFSLHGEKIQILMEKKMVLKDILVFSL